MRSLLTMAALAVLAACSTDRSLTAPTTVSADVDPSAQGSFCIMPYSFGPNGEILEEGEGGYDVYSFSIDVHRLVIPGFPAITYTTAVQSESRIPGPYAPYNSGSAGINVLTEDGWHFVTSVNSDASASTCVVLPLDARVQIVAVPNSGKYFNAASNSNFVVNSYGIGVFETNVRSLSGVEVRFNFGPLP